MTGCAAVMHTNAGGGRVLSCHVTSGLSAIQVTWPTAACADQAWAAIIVCFESIFLYIPSSLHSPPCLGSDRTLC